MPQTGLPAELIQRRPDIRSAYYAVQAADSDLAAAIADRFPRLSLTAGVDTSGAHTRDLFDNWAGNLAASLTGPIFDGGLRRAEIKRAKAFAQEQLNFYARTVANAIREVEDSLVSMQKQAEYIKLLEEELAVVRLTLKDAMVQYQNGKSSYLSYLIAWSSIERLERQLVGERANIIKDRIGFHRALGWQSTPQLK